MPEKRRFFFFARVYSIWSSKLKSFGGGYLLPGGGSDRELSSGVSNESFTQSEAFCESSIAANSLLVNAVTLNKIRLQVSSSNFENIEKISD